MKQQKKVSHTAYWRALYEADERAVLFFTGMTDGELMDMKLDMGQEWLVKHLAIGGINKEVVAVLWKRERMLKWWNLNWRQYDHFYVLPYLHKVTDGERLNVYRDMHLNVFSKDHPQYQVLHDQLLGIIDTILEQDVRSTVSTVQRERIANSINQEVKHAA